MFHFSNPLIMSRQRSAFNEVSKWLGPNQQVSGVVAERWRYLSITCDDRRLPCSVQWWWHLSFGQKWWSMMTDLSSDSLDGLLCLVKKDQRVLHLLKFREKT